MGSTALYGLVLAGGKSRRMGTDKALLEHEGRSQLAHVVQLVEPRVDRVFVSARPDQQDEPERSRYGLIIDRYNDMGPLAGILSAMEEYPEADWLVVACDLPNISGETLANLVASCSDNHPFTAYISSHDGLPEPLCAVWRSGTSGIIRGFVDEGVRCPRKILIRSDTHLIEQLDPASLDNVNTPDDLASSILEKAV
jgi:molybdopterin-guanine dinucleotide biosynthesis protein A